MSKNVQLGWTQSSFVDEFVVDRKSDSVWERIGVTQNLYYFDESIEKEKEYIYRVGAVRGTQVQYSAELSVSTHAVVVNDPFWRSVELLVFADANEFPSSIFIDSSLKNNTFSSSETPQIVSPSVSAPRFDNGSIYFDGTSGNKLVSFTADTIGKYDFTVECFLKIPTIIASSPLNVVLFDLGGLSLDFNSNYTTLAIRYYSSAFESKVVRGIWQHFCMMRIGNEFNVYVDGLMIGGATISDRMVQQKFAMGEGSSPNRSLNAFVNSIRFTKGVRYNVEGFTPPNEKFQTS